MVRYVKKRNIMGMFDYINCEYPLPRPSDLMEMKDYDFTKFRFQTKDLDDLLDLYEIREDGTLWVEKYNLEVNEENKNKTGIDRIIGSFTRTNERWEPMKDFMGSITFYDGIMNDLYSNDYWIEYSTLFEDGKLIKIKLVEFKATDNSDRKESTEKFKQLSEHERIFKNQWFYKYGFRYYDNIISFIFRTWRKMIYKIKLPCSYKIERWLRFL